MISDAYPLPDALPRELQDKIHMHILDAEGTPSSRVIKQTVADYYKKSSKKKKQREWNVYSYWGIQYFGRQCEMDSRNSCIYPLHIWCEVRKMMLSYNFESDSRTNGEQQFYKLEELQRGIFKRRYEYLFA